MTYHETIAIIQDVIVTDDPDVIRQCVELVCTMREDFVLASMVEFLELVKKEMQEVIDSEQEILDYERDM